MLNSLRIVLAAALANLKSRRELALENLALRQQLAVLGRRTKRPKITWVDRAFWVALRRWWPDWSRALMLVKPATVIAWHRKGFAIYWARKSRKAGGRPRVDIEVRSLIRRMANDNIGWGAPRIHGELLKHGFTVSASTVSRYMPRPRVKAPSQTWRTFLRNHKHCAVGVDFFVVPTATFRLLYVFVVLDHARRRIVHVNVTEQPSARWTAQQVIEAFPYDTAPRYLHRDRDSIYGSYFNARVQGNCIRSSSCSCSHLAIARRCAWTGLASRGAVGRYALLSRHCLRARSIALSSRRLSVAVGTRALPNS